jgi:hypothetical protein
VPLRLFGRSRVRLPDLVTVLVAHQPDGTLEAEFIGEGSLPPESRGYADMDTLVSAVERAVLDLYRSSPTETPVPMGFQYAWYPWGEDKKALKMPGGPREFLVFEIRQSISGYEVWLPTEPTISTASPRLAELPSLIAGKTLERWPTLVGRAIPGMLHWNRELTAVGFRDLPIPGT